MKIIKILVLLTVAVVLMACSFTVNVPTVKTGVTQTFAINEPLGPSSESATVRIEMGAGKLEVSGGSSQLVEGEVVYNVDSWKPTIVRDGNSVKISQKNNANVGIPDGTIKNQWNLKLGSLPTELDLATGANESNLNLSGIPLIKLTISDGASKSDIKFETPNPSEMVLLQYKTGASDVNITGLGNANVSDVTFEGGVGSFHLDFSGDLTRDLNAKITSGMSDIKLVFPAGRHVKVVVNGGVSNIDMTGTWTVTNNSYEFGTSGPLISIIVDMGLGNLQLIQQ